MQLFGQVIAGDVSREDYLAHYAESRYEWVQGYVVKMSPISLKHDAITFYLRLLLAHYFSLRPIGVVVGDPFVMALEDSYRQPDLQVILNDNPGNLTDTAMIGAADICIEVVSPGSVKIDYGEKFEEYEIAGVKEYWIIDPLRKDQRFNCRTSAGVYENRFVDADGNYQTALLPGLVLHMPTLWQDQLPDAQMVAAMVEKMLS